ncbi:DNJB8 protein, partial [Centropus bengalensis]|nr:DNJB8 protein [Centropus bengalensis]
IMDYYKVLELQKGASQDDIKKSYHKLAKKWHPDKNPSNKEEAEKKFKAVAEAYQVLSDPQKRWLYDRSVKGSRSHRGRRATEGRSHSFDSPYVFQNLEETFREFFEVLGPPLYVFWDPFDNSRSRRENWCRSSRGQRSSDPFSDYMELFMPWNLFSPNDQSAYFFAEDAAGSHNVRSVLTTTKVINGKRITTRKIIENGKERIEVEEDGQLKSVKIN